MTFRVRSRMFHLFGDAYRWEKTCMYLYVNYILTIPHEKFISWKCWHSYCAWFTSGSIGTYNVATSEHGIHGQQWLTSDF